MSTWALIGLSIALLIAGFNIGYDCRHKKVFLTEIKNIDTGLVVFIQ